MDSASVTAERVAAAMTDEGNGSVTYYATGDTKAFAHTARMTGGVGHAVHAIN
ncbi:MAG TPA: hypothetical protein VGF49_14755 [Candidatus Solibacter sp.]